MQDFFACNPNSTLGEGGRGTWLKILPNKHRELLYYISDARLYKKFKCSAFHLFDTSLI